ncbi:50S ribosomal protein L25 [Chloroflexota bacterium]
MVTRLHCRLSDKSGCEVIIEITGFHFERVFRQETNLQLNYKLVLPSMSRIGIDFVMESCYSSSGKMAVVELAASARQILGKKTRFLRRQGITPANLCGHNIESVALQIETVDLKHIITRVGKTSLIALKIAGEKNPKTVMLRDIQRSPRSGDLLHVDLYQIKMKEKIKLEIPLQLVGEPFAVKQHKGMLLHNLNSVEVECLPSDLVDSFEINISGLEEVDQAILVQDIQIPAGITVLTDVEKLVVKIIPMKVEVEAEVEEEAPVSEAEEQEKIGEAVEDGG